MCGLLFPAFHEDVFLFQPLDGWKMFGQMQWHNFFEYTQLIITNPHDCVTCKDTKKIKHSVRLTCIFNM